MAAFTRNSQELSSIITKEIEGHVFSFVSKIDSFITNVSKKFNIPTAELFAIANDSFNPTNGSTEVRCDVEPAKETTPSKPVAETNPGDADADASETVVPAPPVNPEPKKDISADFPEDILMPFIPSQVSTHLCQALKRNCGLYTQCTKKQKKNSQFCSICAREADKNGGVPKYGTVELRNQVALDAFVDPQGKKCVNYTTVLKKKSFTSIQARAYADAHGFEIPEVYFTNDVTVKKSRKTKKTKAPVDDKKAAVKTHKKPDIVIGGSESDDLFAALAQATENAKVVSTSSKKETESTKKDDMVDVQMNERIIDGVSYHYDEETQMLYNPVSGEPVGVLKDGNVIPNDQLEEEEYTA